MIERELVPAAKHSRLRETLEKLMVEHPGYWKSHYHGSDDELKIQRVHSYSDRIRYYWNFPEAQQAVALLMENLEAVTIPATLISDYLPLQFEKIRAGLLAPKPLPLVFDAIQQALRPYSDAVA
jgi:D-tagatose-1,6-bisphosphate aldolase subunit GatZ/KbaZ